MDESNAAVESPYKFLDYYKPEDRDIFFGRESEKRILLADVIVARLVLLFAKTGTGKTSLINAGVRPILKEQGYETFFIRVKKDPVESARREILNLDNKDDPELSGEEHISTDGRLAWKGKSFADKLENVARQLGKPIVLFFDQFEEFFIYPLEEEPARDPKEQRRREREREEQIAKRREFVKDIATMYHDLKSRVHVVFSMREEWFIEMDIFRDEIPKIYHNDSNLRLRWFDLSQAREAIKLPVEEYNVTITDETVDRLIADIAVNGLVEPAQLQIVCDTLWRETKGDRITLEDYLRLGRPDGNEIPDSNPTIAKQILYRRLEKEFEKIESDEHLYLFYALLPKLRTPQKTKYVRDIDALIKELTANDVSLREIVTDEAERQALIERLKTSGREMLLDLSAVLERKLGLIRKGIRDNLDVIELSHDYLVESLSELQKRVKAIGPRRLLDETMSRHTSSKEPVPFEDFEKISCNADVLRFSREQAEVMFRSALAHGNELYMKLWFDLAVKDDAWAVLEEKINDIEETSHVIDLLAELQTPEAFDLIEKTLQREEIASYAVEVFSLKETLPVVGFLAKALRHDHLMPRARGALARFEKSRKHPAVAARARDALEKFETEQQRRGPEEEASEAPFREVALPVARNFDSFQSTTSTASLEPHYRMVVKAIADGRVIPFLGAGVNSMARPLGSGWQPSLYLPSDTELPELLAEKFGYPAYDQHDEHDLMRVTQYAAAVAGKAALYDELRRLLDYDYPPNPLHKFLASLPAILRDKGYAARAQLILTTNYDDALERAFKEIGEPYDLMSYVSEGEQRGRFLHWPHDGEPRVIENPSDYRPLKSDQHTVILKIVGGIDRSNPERDSFVITEDDYIEQLITDISSLIPVTLAARLRRSFFLFLGHSLRAWNLRVILRRIWGEQRLNYKSWSIQRNPERIDQELWQKRGVDVLNVPLEEYVAALREHVHNLL